MPTVCELNRGIVTNASKYNLAEGLGLKSQYKFLCQKIMSAVKISMKIKIDNIHLFGQTVNCKL